MTSLTLNGLPTWVTDADAPAKAPIIVAMHGIGSNELDLAPAYRAFAPQAVLAFPRSPLDHPPGYAWYRLIRIGVPDPASFEQAQQKLGQWLEALRATADYAERPLILSGFSQGAIMALSYALLNPGKVQGVMAFSGYIPDVVAQSLPARRSDQPLSKFFLTLGRRDQLFPASRLDEAAALLRSQGAQPTVVPHDSGHDIPPSAVEAASRWLSETFPT